MITQFRHRPFSRHTVILPGSLMPLKDTLLAFASPTSSEDMVVITDRSKTQASACLARVAEAARARGYRVTTINATSIGG